MHLAVEQDGPALTLRARGRERETTAAVDVSIEGLEDWNAEPNAPMPEVRIEAGDVILTVFANPWRLSGFEQDDRVELRFAGASRYRLGATHK